MQLQQTVDVRKYNKFHKATIKRKDTLFQAKTRNSMIPSQLHVFNSMKVLREKCFISASSSWDNSPCKEKRISKESYLRSKLEHICKIIEVSIRRKEVTI